METEISFELPRGYLDNDGQIHKSGRMRLARAKDEVDAMQDPRVRVNASYLPISLLSRVVTQLGSLTAVSPQIVEAFFASDLAYLQELYMQVNRSEQIIVGTVCPTCHQQFQVQVSPLGA
ncbi:MAG: hypothetical protein KC421_08510 [Anaerolineales bacterium]|nr:hypothetical protein [Anaerolineales bacterium]